MALKYLTVQNRRLSNTSAALRMFSTSENKVIKDKEQIKKEYVEIFKYAQENLVYKCGNLNNMPSRFGFFRRWRLEK